MTIKPGETQWMRNQLNELKSCWIHPGTLCSYCISGFVKQQPQNKLGCTLLTELRGWNTQTLPPIFTTSFPGLFSFELGRRPDSKGKGPGNEVGIFSCFALNTPKNPYLNQAAQNNTRQILKKKSRNRKFQTPKNPSIIPVV